MAADLKIEIHVLVGETGDYVVARDRDSLVEAYEQEFGTLPPATRNLTLELTMAPPGATVIRGEVAAKEDGPARLTIVK